MDSKPSGSLEDMVGYVSGKLTVLSLSEERIHGMHRWLCQCECGNTCYVAGSHLRQGRKKSCGCLKASLVGKPCSKCNEPIDLPKGGRCKKCANKASREWYHNNKERQGSISKKWREDNPERYFELSIFQKYGIDLDDYYKLLKDQNGLCAICNKTCARKHRLAIDHCHTTGKVRGLLCERCNHGLGNFKDNIDSLKNAIKYLENGMFTEVKEQV